MSETQHEIRLFTTPCYAERHYATVCRMSVRLSVRPSLRDVQVPWSHMLEYFESNFTAD